jgi:hypothetical protein
MMQQQQQQQMQMQQAQQNEMMLKLFGILNNKYIILMSQLWRLLSSK